MKLQMYSKYYLPTYDFKDLAQRLPYHVDATIQNYKRHFETTTGGGRLMGDELYRAGLKTYLTGVAKANRFDFNLKGFAVSDQLKIKNLIYWTGRVIDGPTGIVITIFPGIWTDIFSKPNFVPAAMEWVNSYQISQFIQKCTVLGIRIDKLTGIPLPWAGVSFVTLPPPFSTWSAVKAGLIGSFNQSMDLLLAVYLGKEGIAVVEEMKQTYAQIIDTVFTPELLNTFESIPSPYGLDWRTLSGVISDTAQAVSPLVGQLSGVTGPGDRCNAIASKIIDDFTSQILPSILEDAAGGVFGVSAQGVFGFRKLIFLAGPLGTEDQKAEYILRRFRRDDRRFFSLEEAKENVYFLNFSERLKNDSTDIFELSPLSRTVTFTEKDIRRVIQKVSSELKEGETLLLNPQAKPFTYITTQADDTPVVISDFFPKWYDYYRFSFQRPSTLNEIQNFPTLIQRQLQDLDSEYDTYRFYEQGEADWTNTSQVQFTSGYLQSDNIEGNPFLKPFSSLYQRLDEIADNISFLLYDTDNFQNKDIIVDIRNLRSEERIYLLDKVKEKIPSDLNLFPYIRMFLDEQEKLDEVSRIFFNSTLFDPCGPLIGKPSVPDEEEDCHFFLRQDSDSFIAVLGDCDNDVSTSLSFLKTKFKSLLSTYYREIFDFQELIRLNVNDNRCRKYVLATKSMNSITLQYTDCSTGRVLRNNISSNDSRVETTGVFTFCSSTVPVFTPNNFSNIFAFCDTCYVEDDPKFIEDLQNKRSIFQIRDCVKVQLRRCQSDPKILRQDGFRILTDKQEFPYFRDT
jgi:hypothetical protein